jgi:hypothetical protein
VEAGHSGRALSGGGRLGTFHVIMSRTRIMGWHLSPRYCCASKHIQLMTAGTVVGRISIPM